MAHDYYLISFAEERLLFGPAPAETCAEEMRRRNSGAVARADSLFVRAYRGGKAPPARRDEPATTQAAPDPDADLGRPRQPWEKPYAVPCIDCREPVWGDPARPDTLHVKCESCRSSRPPAAARPAKAPPAPAPAAAKPPQEAKKKPEGAPTKKRQLSLF